ncbi:MAG TPA: S-layer homology domain-containing protein [Abditibacteriaceae bacterium]|jgi:uncharacterized repeat protein (TIGR01451 family)
MAAALSVLAGVPASVQAAQLTLPAPAPQPMATTMANGVTRVRVPRGGRWTIPLAGVTRIVPADDDVARGSFAGTGPAIEGVTNGETLVEVYQGANRRQIYAISVEDALLTTANSGATTAISAPVSNTVPTTGTPVAPISATTGTVSGPEVTIPSDTPVVIATDTTPRTGGPMSSGQSSASLPANPPVASVAGRSNLQGSMRYAAVPDNLSQSLFTITYSNRSNVPAQGVVIRSALDDVVSYVTGSATNGGRYDATTRELVWNIGTVEAGAVGRTVSFRVQPVDSKATTFYSVATLEDASGTNVSTNMIKMGTGGAPLLTVFALPDRFLAGRNANVLTDVKGVDFQRAIDRLQAMGVVDGRGSNRYYPADATQRAEYAVMTLRGLNLKDLRDVTAIKFVLGRRSTVSMNIVNSAGKVVATLLKGQQFDAGEKTVIWDGRAGTGYAAPGRYKYVCTARDAMGQSTKLEGTLTIVPQTPVDPNGTPSFIDVKPTDWYAGYLALAENQNLMNGYPGKTFQPTRAISRVEATAVVVRALGLEDLARQMQNQSVGFLDYQNIPKWANGYVNVASTVAKTRTGKVIVGYPSNFFLPLNPLRRDEAALTVQRLIDKETTRRVAVSGQLAPGASVTINGQNVESNDDGEFSFVIEQNTAEPTSIAVLGNLR